MRKALVIGNWKMNGTEDSIGVLLDALVKDNLQSGVVVCPSSVYLSMVGKRIAGSNIALGAQNIDHHDSGAYTGEISASMLLDVSCEYCIVGHSERRMHYGEASLCVAKKFSACIDAKITPVLCVGETQAQRLSGETEVVVGLQLDTVLDLLGVASFANAIIAYEPVWAIGTGETASPAQADSVHGFIRGKLSALDEKIAEQLSILYGGSVTEQTAAELFSKENIDGALVGGASLKPKEFAEICRLAQISQQ